MKDVLFLKTNLIYVRMLVARLLGNGTMIWQKQLGSSLADDAKAVAIDSQNRIHMCGSTRGDVAAPNAGLNG